ncbi:hypothetical protein PAL_GLEAN10008395 [Pteropus alecto]|uniref:Uncharacterized protein n=1 Tax=Pteropus alecto TaxID=9402 RepID=L5KAW5_PTEAL|nr:hypothetical protein PAL_GLEAN10008395 [Pteropus alecto]
MWTNSAGRGHEPAQPQLERALALPACPVGSASGVSALGLSCLGLISHFTLLERGLEGQGVLGAPPAVPAENGMKSALPIRAPNHESRFLRPPPPRSIINVRWPVGRSCGQNPLPRLEPSGGAGGLTLTLEHGSLPETPEAVDGTGRGRVWDQLHQQAP